tara:strand:- start:159 stop:1082 length:924 start_codon:yes stop_codon:yes gene_type:complete
MSVWKFQFARWVNSGGQESEQVDEMEDNEDYMAAMILCDLARVAFFYNDQSTCVAATVQALDLAMKGSFFSYRLQACTLACYATHISAWSGGYLEAEQYINKSLEVLQLTSHSPRKMQTEIFVLLFGILCDVRAAKFDSEALMEKFAKTEALQFQLNLDPRMQLAYTMKGYNSYFCGRFRESRFIFEEVLEHGQGYLLQNALMGLWLIEQRALAMPAGWAGKQLELNECLSLGDMAEVVTCPLVRNVLVAIRFHLFLHHSSLDGDIKKVCMYAHKLLDMFSLACEYVKDDGAAPISLTFLWTTYYEV